MLLKAKTRNHDIGSTFTSHARRIGLLSSRQRAGTWYAPTDALLEALVLANVRGAMELSEFLTVMHARYHAVIGPVFTEGAGAKSWTAKGRSWATRRICDSSAAQSAHPARWASTPAPSSPGRTPSASSARRSNGCSELSVNGHQSLCFEDAAEL